MSLATITDIENLLQEDLNAADEAYATVALDQAQAIVDTYCNQPLKYVASIIDIVEATSDSVYLWLQFPVTAVATVVEDTNILTVTDDYRWYQDGRLRRMSGDYSTFWSTQPDAVTVTYAAGYGGAGITTPNDLSYAVALVALGVFNKGRATAEQGASAIKSVTLDGSDTVTYADQTDATGGITSNMYGGVTPQVKALLTPYMRRPL